MAAWVAPLIMVGAQLLGIGIDHAQRPKQHRYDAQDKLGEYNEWVRQQKVATESFQKQTATSYGTDFYSKLISGGSYEELIGAIGEETSLGMRIAQRNMEMRARIEGTKRQVVGEGEVAALEGEMLATQSLAQEISSKQAMGEAQAIQATSGIRAGAGTGSNIAEMQELENKISQRHLQQQIQMSTRAAYVSAEVATLNAKDAAEVIRQQRDTEARTGVEDALNRYVDFHALMQELDASQEGALTEYEWHMSKTTKRQKGKIKGELAEDTIDASQFKFIDD